MSPLSQTGYEKQTISHDTVPSLTDVKMYITLSYICHRYCEMCRTNHLHKNIFFKWSNFLEMLELQIWIHK